MVLDQRRAVSHADEADAGVLDPAVKVLLVFLVECAGGFIKECEFRLAQEQHLRIQRQHP